MSRTGFGTELAERVAGFVREGFSPSFGQLGGRFGSLPLWRRLRELGTELWLDTGSIAEAEELWTREFSALTTNNTLLNKEVQSGVYDELIERAAKLLDEFPDMTDQERKLELAFILNARHGLRLVEKFDAFVSVEEHTDLTHDVDGSVEYARRYHAICPERFYVKIPFSAAGLLATRKVAAEGIPVNHTLGFSGRQNYLIARIGRPAYVNVFLGRLNSVVADNKLGDGSYVGERATLTSQTFMVLLRQTQKVPSHQIGASLRQGRQVIDLAGIDVMTIPPKVAREFLAMDARPEDLTNRTGENYWPPLYEGVDPELVRLDTLWSVNDRLRACVDELEKQDLDRFTPDDLIDFLARHKQGDLLVRWAPEQIRTSAEEGKIPDLATWRDELKAKRIGLDTLMNLAGWNSFDADQRAMDQKVQDVLGHVGQR